MRLAEKWRQSRRGGLYLPERAGIITRAEFRVYDLAGTEVDGWETGNLIVDDGKSVMMGQLFGVNVTGLINGNTFTYNTPMNSLGVGTDSTAAATTQFKLNPSVSGSVLIQAMSPATTVAASSGAGAAVATVQSTFGTGVGNFSWNEWGIFNGTTNGTSVMFDRSVFGAFNKTSAVSIILTATISQS